MAAESPDEIFDSLRLDPGTRIGPYRVESFLARGGMGVVLKAVDENLGRPVAIKLIDPRYGADEEFRARFERECRVLAQLRHPNVVTVYYQDQWQGAPYFAMELVSGVSLQRRLEDAGRVDWRTGSGWLQQCLEALEAARRKGVIHRDLKPGNILLDDEGQVRIVDFGLAKLAHLSSNLTSANVFVGTPLYASPEQVKAQPLDWRSDLYSLGATFYHLFSGRPVFDHPSVAEIVAAHVREPAGPLRDRVPGIPAELAERIDRTLAKDPAARGADGYSELAAAVARIRAAAPLVEIEAAATKVGNPISPVADTVVAAEAGVDPAGSDPGGRDAVRPGATLLARLRPVGPSLERHDPEILVVRCDRFEIGRRTSCPLFLPDDPGRPRIPRRLGEVVWTAGGYRLLLEAKPDQTTGVGLRSGSELAPGRHEFVPGTALEVRGVLSLRVEGSRSGGLRLSLEARPGTAAAKVQGLWYWVLMEETIEAGSGVGAGIRVEGGEPAFVLEWTGAGLAIRPGTAPVTAGGDLLEGPRPLCAGDLIEGPGFGFRYVPVATAEELWTE